MAAGARSSSSVTRTSGSSRSRTGAWPNSRTAARHRRARPTTTCCSRSATGTAPRSGQCQPACRPGSDRPNSVVSAAAGEPGTRPARARRGTSRHAPGRRRPGRSGAAPGLLAELHQDASPRLRKYLPHSGCSISRRSLPTSGVSGTTRIRLAAMRKAPRPITDSDRLLGTLRSDQLPNAEFVFAGSRLPMNMLTRRSAGSGA